MAKKQSRGTQDRRWLWIGVAAVVVIIVILGAVLLLGGDDDDDGKDNNQDATAAALASLPAEISVEEAAEKRDQGAFILDVRQQDEWEEYHIADATLIPLDELPARLSEVPKDQEIVVVCRSGSRSAQGRDTLLEAGYTSVTSMAGGMSQWRDKGYPTVAGP